MVFNYFILFGAVLLLWLPRKVFSLGKTVLPEPRGRSAADQSDPRKSRNPGDISVRFLEEVAKPRNYLDLLRGLGGAFLLLGTEALGAAIAAKPHAPPSVGHEIFIAQALVLTIGVAVQTLRFDGRARLYPPIFYLTGIVFALAGWKTAGFATILVWLVNRSLPSAIGFFAGFALLLAGFGFVFGRSLDMFLACALLFLPAALSLLSRRPLIAMSRKAARSKDE